MEDPAQLLLAYQGKVDFDLKLAVQQIQARQKAKNKLPEWTADTRLLFPASLSLEQASSTLTANFKSSLFEGHSLLDVTGGFGIDTFYLGQRFKQVQYCERQEELAAIAKHNFEVLAPGKVKVLQGDGITFLRNTDGYFDLIYLDPARRGQANEKLYRLADCEPDIVSNWQLLRSKGKKILCKISPMTDIKMALQEIPDFQQVWVVSVKNEVKEVLMLCQNDWQGEERQIHAVDLSAGTNRSFSFTYAEEATAKYQISSVRKFLIEPLAAILKAGAFRTFAQRYNLEKLHNNSHLYTTDILIKNLPARIFEVVELIENPKKEIPKIFSSGKANVLTRNYSLTPEALKKKYKLIDGGEAFLIGTKIMSGDILIHAKRLQ
jgi:16S rRNA G966 N2-methylase RsmD